MLNSEEILSFINHNPVCHLATCEEGQPHVRGLLMYRADKSGLIFHTGDFKSLFRQLRQNPRVEVCFNSGEIQVRIKGHAEFTENQTLKEEIAEARPFMQPWIEQKGWDMLKVFKVTNCEYAIWTMDTNHEPTRFHPL